MSAGGCGQAGVSLWGHIVWGWRRGGGGKRGFPQGGGSQHLHPGASGRLQSGWLLSCECFHWSATVSVAQLHSIFTSWFLAMSHHFDLFSHLLSLAFVFELWMKTTPKSSSASGLSPTLPSGLAKTTLQGTVKGGRRQGRQRKRWEDNIREWTGSEFGKSQRAAENRGKWRKLVANHLWWPNNPQG